MLTYTVTPLRHKRKYIEANVETAYGIVQADVLMCDETIKWPIGKERKVRGYIETKMYGPNRVLVLRIPLAENKEVFCNIQNTAWNNFAAEAKKGVFDESSYMSMCENGLPETIDFSVLSTYLMLLGKSYDDLEKMRRVKAEKIIDDYRQKSESQGYLDENDNHEMIAQLRSCGSLYDCADDVRDIYETLEKEWLKISFPEKPRYQYVFFDNAVYEIRNVYTRTHGQKKVKDENFNEDMSWKISDGLRTPDWVGSEICWRAYCRNIMGTDAGNAEYFKAQDILDAKRTYFDSIRYSKEIRTKIRDYFLSIPSDVFEGKSANSEYDSLLQQNIIFNSISQLLVENTDSYIFTDYDPKNAVLERWICLKEVVPEEVYQMILSLSVHDKKIKWCRETLSKSDMYFATKGKINERKCSNDKQKLCIDGRSGRSRKNNDRDPECK
ncbi:MAG: hypothetical protein IJI14_10525 [Anaerolineaceae bacterium]|nr:hypothetical protein [Anaerolineaceae bacterium]